MNKLNQYSRYFTKDYLMGPNSFRLREEARGEMRTLFEPRAEGGRPESGVRLFMMITGSFSFLSCLSVCDHRQGNRNSGNRNRLSRMDGVRILRGL